MLSRLLSMVVLLGFILPPQPSNTPVIYSTTEHILYLPVVTNDYPLVNDYRTLVNVIEIGVERSYEYGGDTCWIGYTIGTTPSAVYSVTFAFEVIIYPYCPEEPCPPPVSETDYGKPALNAILLEQKNPLSYCRTTTKAGYDFGAVRLDSASLTPPNGRDTYPLTVTSWTKEGIGWETTVSGIVRNDSGQRLVEIRVVGLAGLCAEKEDQLEATILDPGKETGFIFNQFYCQAWGPGGGLPMVEISAQGVAEP